MYKLFVRILPLILLSKIALADSLAGKKYDLFAAKVNAPSSDGWQLIDKSEVKVTFMYNHENFIKTAQASFFAFPPPHEKSNLLEITKKNIAELTSTGGSFIAEPKFEYTNLQANPCVKATFPLKYTVAVKGSSLEKQIIFQYHFLACNIPLYENTGLLVSFAYSSEKSTKALDQEVELFISGIKVQEK